MRIGRNRKDKIVGNSKHWTSFIHLVIKILGVKNWNWLIILKEINIGRENNKQMINNKICRITLKGLTIINTPEQVYVLHKQVRPRNRTPFENRQMVT